MHGILLLHSSYVPKYYFHHLGKLPPLANSYKPLTNFGYVASVSLFYRSYFGKCSIELPELASLLLFCAFLKKLGFTPCKTEQALLAMELQEKEAEKIKAYWKFV